MKEHQTPISFALTDEVMLNHIVAAHDADRYDVSVAKRNLLYLMASTPIFSPFLLYDGFSYQTNANMVYTLLNRMQKNGLIKTISIGGTDNELRTLYYITKQGHAEISSIIPTVREYHGKQGRRILETGVHDFGCSYTYLAYFLSPLHIHQVTYEDVTRFDAAIMPKGKRMLRNIRHDAVLSVSSDTYRGKIYLEHDTGTETLSILVNKLPQYASHQLMDQNDIILFTFRKGNPSRPSCFRKGELSKLIQAMPEDVSVDAFAQLPTTPSALLPTLETLDKYTPAFHSHWKKEQLAKMLARITDMQDDNLLRYFRYAQDSFAYSRRDGMLRILLDAFQSDTSAYTHAIGCMLSGSRVLCTSASTLAFHLPYLHMAEYPDTLQWVSDVLSPYYGNVTYTDSAKTYRNTLPGKLACTMRNIFHSDKLQGDISLEYVSRDISGILKAYAILHRHYDVRSNNLSIILLVDSFADACRIADMLGYLYNISTLPYDRMFISFLTIGKDYLYTVSPEHKEVRIKADRS